MPILVYVGHSRQAQIPHEPDHSHEVDAIIEICQSLREHFESSSRTYAVLVSPQHFGRAGRLYADVVILTELGFGVLELKDYSGKIICKRPNKKWVSEQVTRKTPLKAGKYVNPHQQVQHYGMQIWGTLTSSSEGIPQAGFDDKKVKLQTAVCFSNINADVEECKRNVQKYYQNRKVLKSWEKKFEVLTLPDVPNWVLQLRFEIEESPHNPLGMRILLNPKV